MRRTFPVRYVRNPRSHAPRGNASAPTLCVARSNAACRGTSVPTQSVGTRTMPSEISLPCNCPSIRSASATALPIRGRRNFKRSCQAAREGVEVAPVWNKSHREHTIVGSRPADVRAEADRAVQSLGWTGPYFVDADHISLKTVDGFLEASDFFTLDVADWIGRDAGRRGGGRFRRAARAAGGPALAARHRSAAGNALGR